MTVELAIPVAQTALVESGWWHDVALPIIDVAEWDDLNQYDAELKAHIAIFELLGREDKIELLKAKRVVDKRRGDLLGEAEHGGDHRSKEFQLPHEVVEIHHTSATRYRRLAAAWPVLETHLLEATVSTEVSQRALLDLAKIALEDEEPTVKTNGQKIPRVKRAKQIERLAGQGHRASQISDKLGVAVETIQSIANEYDINLPLGKMHHTIEPNDVIEQIVAGLEGSVTALDVISGMYDQLDPAHLDYWISSLTKSLRKIQNLRARLKAHQKEVGHS